MPIAEDQQEVTLNTDSVIAGKVQSKKQQCSISAKHVGMTMAALTAIYGITIYFGPNLFQVPEDERDAFTYINTGSSVLMNFFIMFVIGGEPLENAASSIAATTRVAIAKCRGTEVSKIDRDNLPTLAGVGKSVIYTAGSAFASVIYADIAPTLANSPLSFVNTPAGYAGLIFANLFFHYYGTQAFLNKCTALSQDAISDWMIALGPNRAKQYYLARSLDRDIEAFMRQQLADSQLAREVEFSKNGSTLPLLSEKNNFYQNAALLSHDHSKALTHAAAQARLKKSLFITLYSSVIMALVPFFSDSFGLKPMKLMSFIGTTIANLGLAMMFTDKYSNAISQLALYRNAPPIFADAKNHKKRVAAAAGIVLVNTALTAFTVHTTITLFNAIVREHIKSQVENIMLIICIWVGTIAFNAYSSNKMMLVQVASRALKDDPRYKFSSAADKLREKQSQELFKDRSELSQQLGESFPGSKKSLWKRHLNHAGGINDPANRVESGVLRQEASCRINRNLYMGLLPVAAAITLTFAIHKTLTDSADVDLATDLGKYGVFVVAQIASQIYHACCAPRTKAAGLELRSFPSDASIDSQPLLFAENEKMQAEINDSRLRSHGDVETGDAKDSVLTPVQQAKAACSLYRLVKGAAAGLAAEWIIRGIYKGLDDGISSKVIDVAATTIGLTAAFACNR
ncbi:MAG: hypothetical protein P1U40_04065 [Coxiellaceae bacterium]|nr:hypothetical protein [Coxiellaceae bacterium]